MVGGVVNQGLVGQNNMNINNLMNTPQSMQTSGQHNNSDIHHVPGSATQQSTASHLTNASTHGPPGSHHSHNPHADRINHSSPIKPTAALGSTVGGVVGSQTGSI